MMSVRIRRIASFLVALLLALALHYLLLGLFPKTLHTSTRIIGYPIHANFNIDRLFWQMYLPMFFLPVASYCFFCRLDRTPVPSLTPSFPRRGFPADTLLTDFLVGGTLGLFAFFAGAGPAASFAFGGLLLAAIGLRYRLPGTEALAGLLSIFLLALFSAQTKATHFDGAITPLPWFPWPLAIITACWGALLLWRAHRRGRGHLLLADRKWAIGISCAVLLQLIVANAEAPNALVSEFFHNGETLVSGKLFLEGYFPWRDCLFIHGLWEDPLKSVLGYALYDRSSWGALNGESLILLPLCFLAYVPLWVAFFRRNLSLLVLAALFLPLFGGSWYGYVTRVERHTLYPLSLLMLLTALCRRDKRSAGFFIFTLFVYAILSPESSYFVPCALLAVVGYEFFQTGGWRRRFRLTLACLAWGSTLTVLWLVYLARHHALGSFFDYYRIFAGGHRFTGGIPLTPTFAQFKAIAYAPTAAVFALFWLVAERVRAGRKLSPLHWTVIAAALYLVLYYQKFLARADAHVLQSYAIGVPVYFYLLGLAVSKIDAKLRTALRLRHALASALLVAFAAVNWGDFQQGLRTIPSRFAIRVSPEADSARPRYLLMSTLLRRQLDHLHAFLDEHLAAGEKIFDFSNAPLLYFDLLDRRPATRYFHVSMAIPPAAQNDLISELEKESPRLVVFDGTHGMGQWDGVPNEVRHHLVSRYLLRHYRPFAEVEGEVFYQRNDVAWTDENARAGTRECDWGTVPAFWRETSSSAIGEPLSFRVVGSGGEQLAEIARPTTPARFGTLHFTFKDPVGSEFYLGQSAAQTHQSLERIRFRALPTDHLATYPVDVGGCHQWYQWTGRNFYLRFPNGVELRSVTLSD